jgi:radical SAM protein with 4Fe4S-binding SPASM domain
VIRGGIRAAYRRRIGSPLDWHFRDGYSAPLVQIDLKLTNACNLRCKMCGQWGETGWHLIQPTSFLRDTVSLEQYRTFINDVAPWWPWMFIYGGEPMLYRDFLPVTEYMKRQGLLVSVVTNGTLLEKMSDDVVKQELDFVMVSIDGPRDTHDEIRGMKGSYDRAVSGLAAVQERRNRLGNRKPYTLLITTISRHNTGHLYEVFELAEDLGVDGLIAYYGYFQTEESCKQHELVMLEKLGTRAISQNGWRWSAAAIDTAELLDTIRRIRSRRWSYAHVFAPDLKDEEVPRFYTNHAETFGYNRCVAPWMMTAVLANGDVAPCRDYPDYVVGNITRGRLTEMWNGDRFRKFRTVLKEETLMPVCRRCCGLMDI